MFLVDNLFYNLLYKGLNVQYKSILGIFLVKTIVLDILTNGKQNFETQLS